MKILLRILFLTALLLPFASCSGEETASADAAASAAQDVATEAVEVATEVSDDVATAVCCGGSCDAPAGTCCDDGTCHGSHAKLPLAP